ncbi:MAG: hypothetical protein ABIK89_13445, partial [Planctomycetota bacterium]
IADPVKNTGVVRVVGVVRNVGKGNFPYRGKARLYLSISGGGFTEDGNYHSGVDRDEMLAQKDFQNLAAGQEVYVTYETKWPVAPLFVPVFKLVVTSDPDGHGDRGDNNVINRAAYTLGKLTDHVPSSAHVRAPAANDRIRVITIQPGKSGFQRTR